MSESERERRGTCCHEAGHAAVLYAYHVPLKAVWVAFTKEKDGWHGEAEPADATADDLPWQDRIVTFAAGKAAEELFECPAPALKWKADFAWIASLLHREGRVAELCPLRAILSRGHDAALRVFDWLIKHERIDGDTFERLMRGDA